MKRAAISARAYRFGLTQTLPFAVTQRDRNLATTPALFANKPSASLTFADCNHNAKMSLALLAEIGALAIAAATPASARYDCDAGYKGFKMKLSLTCAE